MHRVKNHVAASHVKISHFLLEGTSQVYDDNGRECVRNSSVHNPFPVPGEGMANRAEGNDIVYNEESFFLRNLPVMFARNAKPLTLVFQVLEKAEPKTVLNTRQVGYGQTGTDNFGMLEFKLLGWAHFRLMSEAGRVRGGTFTLRLNKKPHLLPPADPARLVPTDSDIEFSLLEYSYDRADVERALRDEGPSRSMGLPKPAEKIPEGAKDVVLDNKPFIPNSVPQYTDKQFTKGHGIDFYIDGARFLPDNVTVTKILLRFVNNDLVDQLNPPIIAVLPKLGGTTFSPVFDFRHELRSDYFDATTLAFISLLTIDKSCNEPRIIGHAAFNLFIDRTTKTQPEKGSDVNVVLNDGAYEVPIVSEEPLRSKPFSVDKVLRCPKLPAATLLLRVRLAPLSDDFKRVLGKDDVPKEEWKARGVWVPRPIYATGAYNNSTCSTRESDLSLYAFRQSRPDPPMRETAKMLLRASAADEMMGDEEFFRWAKDKIKTDQSSKMIDPLFFAKYQPQSGFTLNIDGVHKIGEDLAVITVYKLSHGDKRNTIMNTLIDWDCPMGETYFYDRSYNFKSIEFNSQLSAIIELMAIRIVQGDPVLEGFGWTLLPIFHPQGYIKGGHFQLPVFQGRPNEELLTEMNQSELDPWSLVIGALKNKVLKFKGKTSIFVRLADCQREGGLDTKFDLGTIDYRYLPAKGSELRSLAFNQQVKFELQSKPKLSNLLPNQIAGIDFNKKIASVVIKQFNIKEFNLNV